VCPTFTAQILVAALGQRRTVEDEHGIRHQFGQCRLVRQIAQDHGAPASSPGIGRRPHAEERLDL
jgi:hypothetical protein